MTETTVDFGARRSDFDSGSSLSGRSGRHSQYTAGARQVQNYGYFVKQRVYRNIWTKNELKPLMPYLLYSEKEKLKCSQHALLRRIELKYIKADEAYV
jgi:hypothetical protein